MRTHFITLLIVLLPWRAWVGDAMAVGLVLPSPALAAHQDLQPCHGHVELTHSDTDTDTRIETATPTHTHPGPTVHALVTNSDTPGASVSTEAHDAGCAKCGDCTMCHSVALLQDLFEPQHPALPHFSWPSSHRSFASAVTAPGHKPPIA